MLRNSLKADFSGCDEATAAIRLFRVEIDSTESAKCRYPRIFVTHIQLSKSKSGPNSYRTGRNTPAILSGKSLGLRTIIWSLVLSFFPGADRDRTDDLLVANQALSQLSYGPSRRKQANLADQRILSLIQPTNQANTAMTRTPIPRKLTSDLNASAIKTACVIPTPPGPIPTA